MNHYQKFFLIFLITSASIMATCISPYVVTIGKFFHIDSSTLTNVMSSYLLGYLIGQYVFSKFAKKYNGLLSIKLGLVVAFFGLNFQNIALQLNIYPLFLFGRFTTSLGLSAGLVVGFAIIKDNIAPKDEKAYLSKVAMSFTASIYLSIVASGYLSKIISITNFFGGLTIYPLLLIPITFYLPNSKKYIIGISSIPNWRIFFNIKLLNFSLALSITTLMAYLYTFYGPLIFINEFGFSAKKFSQINLINLSGLLLGSFLYPRISSYLNEKILIYYLLGLLILNMCFLINLNNTDHLKFIIIFFISNIICGLLYPSSTYLALGCGACKTTSSSTMNIIKIGLPVIGFYFSSILKLSDINKLALTIITFIFLNIILMINNSLFNARFFNKKIS